MASDNKTQIFEIGQILNLLTSQKKEDDLTLYDQEVFSNAVHYFGKKYFFKTYPQFLKNLSPKDVSDYIDELKREDSKKTEKESSEYESQKPPDQENSIPPELESLVAEYRHNQDLLNQEGSIKNKKRTLAEQIRIAQAHAKIRQQAELNRQRRSLRGEKFTPTDETFITLGSPKSNDKNTALSPSYKAIQTLAFTYAGFAALPPEIQNEIITQAVELNLVGVTDLDIAIQVTALELKSTNQTPAVQNNLTSIPSSFVSTIHQEVLDIENITQNTLTQLDQNEIVIHRLNNELHSATGKEKETKQTEIDTLLQKNKELVTTLEQQSTRLDTIVIEQTQSYLSHQTNVDHRHSKNIDMPDIIAAANNNIAIIHNNLENHGVKPHLYVPIDDVHLLETAIRYDMPGVLDQFAGIEAEEVAVLIGDPKTQNPELAPQVVLLYSKGLDPKLFSKVRQFAIDNPDSALGKLYTSRKDIFDSASTQIRNISQSPLSQEILKLPTGLQKIFRPVIKVQGKYTDLANKFLGKLTQRIPGGLGNLFKIASNPVGALKSYVGRRIGKFALKKILASSVGKAAEAAAKKLASKILTEGAKKAIIALAAKLGIKLALAATGVGAIVSLAIQAAEIVFEAVKKLISNIKKTTKAIYGEEIKTRDVIGIPIVAVTSVIGGVAAFFTAAISATVAAASSALSITILGVIVGFLFYITTIATAPLLSTLVQLDGTYRPATGNSSAFCSQDIADRAKEISDNLQRGFNQYYNKSPDYPELWNATLFAQDPNPIWQQDVIDWDDMFWCNYLPFKSYEENGKPIRFNFSAMIDDFTNQGVYLDADEITINDICPGMAVFFKIPAGSATLAHVAVVYSVSVDGFNSVESNAPYKTMFYPVDSSGHFQIVDTIKVASFGSL